MVIIRGAIAVRVTEMVRDQTRAALIQAGMHLFAERGFSGTTVGQITEAAGVAKGTYYNYFTTKEDLLLAGMQAAQARVAEAERDRVFREPSTLGRLQRVVRWATLWVTHSPDLAMVWCGERFRRGLEPTTSGFDQVLTEVIAAGQAEGELREDRSAATTYTEILGILLAHVASWYHGGRSSDLAATADQAIAAYLSGAGANPWKERV